MNKQDKVFLEVLSSVLHSKEAEFEKIENYDWFIKELKSQSIYGLFSPYVDDMGLPVTEYSILSEYLGKQIRNYYTIMEDQEKLLQDLSNIPCVVLKGAAAAMLYPCPEYRSMGDIDLLVLPTDFEKAYHVLENLGYVPERTLDNYHRHIGFMSSNHIEIELHAYFSSSENKKQNKLLDDLLYNGILKKVVVEVSDYSIPVLPPLENGLVLLAHIHHHLREGLGLRQIIDWMYFVEKYRTQEFWDEFLVYAEKIGMKKLAIVTTVMCQKYLGCTISLDVSDLECLGDELMEFVLKNGNFGIKKDQTESSTVTVLHDFKNPLIALKKAQQYGKLNWNLSKKYPFLKPFAWIYQILRWIRHGLQSGVTVSSLKAAMDTQKEESDLLERLEVTR